MQLTKFRISTIIIGAILLAGISVPSAYSQSNCSRVPSYGSQPQCRCLIQNQQGQWVWVITNCP